MGELESNKGLRSIILTNFIWRFAERFGAQTVSLIVSLVLARLLMPRDYGIVSLILVITSILQLFVDGGLGNALIQKKDADDLDFSSVFFLNLFFCSILYCILFICAPLISKFYNQYDIEMTQMIRVLGLTVVVSGVKNIQQAYVSKTMQFKKFFFSTLAGTIVAAIVGITMAYRGYGVWSLITQYLINNLIDTIILWNTVRWRPKKAFSLYRIRILMNFGWKWLTASIMNRISMSLRTLIIGKNYSTSELAYYEESNKYSSFFSGNVGEAINSVLFPTMSNAQDDREKLQNLARRSLKISFYVISPLLIGIAFAAESIVRTILTEKWIPMVPYLRILCIAYVFYPIHTVNLNVMKSLGKSGLILKLQIIKDCISLAIIILTIKHGVLCVAYGMLGGDFIGQVINAHPNKKNIEYGYIDQMKDFIPIVLISLVTWALVYPINYIHVNGIVILIMQATCGTILYITLSIIFRIESFSYLLETIKALFDKNNTQGGVQ